MLCPNDSLANLEINDKTSECFVTISVAGTLAVFMILFGVTQFSVYQKYSTPVSQATISQSRLYYVQILVTYLMPILSVAKFLVEIFLFQNGTVYGYQAIYTFTIIFTFIISAKLIQIERNNRLSSMPTCGHGLVLIFFWILVFIAENLVLIQIINESWRLQLHELQNLINFGIFIANYALSCLLLILGIRAPGIVSEIDYLNLHNSSDMFFDLIACYLVDVEMDVSINYLCFMFILFILFPLAVRRSKNDKNLNRFDYTFYDTAIQTNQNEDVSTWSNIMLKVNMISPFIWPKKSLTLQLRVVTCILLVIAGRVANVYVPIYSAKIVESLTAVPFTFRWDMVSIYIGLMFLQGNMGMGFLNIFRNYLWIHIQQYTKREFEISLFRHLHGLSLKWHLARKTGEVLRIMDRGTDSTNNLLSFILFNIGPTTIDIIVGVIFFFSYFNWIMGTVVFITMVLYIVMTIVITEWRTKFQRQMNIADNKMQARSVDSLLNFETVKYYGAEEFEIQAYKEAILDYQNKEFKTLIAISILNTVQNIIVCTGLLAGSLLSVYFVVVLKNFTVGDYVLFTVYIIQLFSPLNYFGTFYRTIQKNFIDMENMFDLINIKPEVCDISDARDLVLKNGQVEFRNVTFSYQRERLVLKNISFVVPPGKTLALVGPSGSGKSTIIRLLFRFYDVDSGSIIIDDQNIQLVTQASLRNSIGVVPQDTVLFNNTIKFNISYGKIDADESEVINCAKAAEIHDRIKKFPDLYDTHVGERGLKLSGGEKQRVAIARTLLKAPAIVLLDEATSALDTKTERQIQVALDQVCANRTTIIVAHRLSTVVHANEILVLKDGEIYERGRHDDLIERNGLYADMWYEQRTISPSDLPINEDLSNTTNFADFPINAESYQHSNF